MNPSPKPIQRDPQKPWGRPKGMLNKRTLEQREFALRVMQGGKGKEGQDEFEAEVRRQFMAGVLPSNITALIIYYWLGKPVERIEVKDKTPQLAELSPQELRERALVVAQATQRFKDAPETPGDSVPEDSEESVH